MQLLDSDISAPPKTILLLAGSPHRLGNTETLLEAVAASAENAGARLTRFYISEGEVAPCAACNGCFATGECIIADRMEDFLALADAADELVVGTPVFMASAPAQLKAVYDRLQARWARRYILGEAAPAKRPAHLLITGTGTDPHGYNPLVGTSKSALALLDFRVVSINDFIGFERDDASELHDTLLKKAASLGTQIAAREGQKSR